MEFQEPESIPAQMTGTWISQDHMGFWAFNSDTTWGHQAGVEGGYANTLNNCFKMDDFTVSSGVSVATSGASLTCCAPGWPGVQLAAGFGGAQSANFSATADHAIFPVNAIGVTNRCTTEILAVRATQNGELVSSLKPTYYRRCTNQAVQ
jgi:hypothetical protein